MEGNPYLSGSLPRSTGNFSRHLTYLVIAGTQVNGEVPSSIGNLVGLRRLVLYDNDLEGPIPSDVGKLSSLLELYLGANRFKNKLPSSFGNMTSLNILSLRGNYFSGNLPESFSNCTNLLNLDLSTNNFSGLIPFSYNRLQGEVPQEGIFRNRTAFSLDGNKELCGGIPELNLPRCSLMTRRKKNSSSLLKILIPCLISGGAFVTVSVYLILYVYRCGRPRKNVASIASSVGTQFMRLSYGDLIRATDGFSEASVIGSGRFGTVYKGILEDGRTLIAVKVLNHVVKGAVKSFIAECNALRGARHRNLLKILSVCESIDYQGKDFKSLIYEFKANGSLEKWLYHEKEGEQYGSLSMIQRLTIAIDVAQALEYLHCGTDSTIVHGDLKPSNILLDHDMTAYVGDFGLAKIISSMCPTQENSNSIGIRGTIGYVAPEYGMSNLVSTQGDVYGYGILLLEIFTNRRPTDDSFVEYINLHNFVSTVLPDRVIEIVDPLIQIEHDMNMINKIKDCTVSILNIGVACSRESPTERMSMTDVVIELHKITDPFLH
ncbi:UNVERIFIED_CONTAM: putative receptor-like protein kinase [Sesamum radiatum]|uniref:non-specific serine/threonine protein kinase n=1 Tax=Sesamum radiatum TaxID=300843 RepID=A0AAW2S7U9_SESRA